MDSSNIVFLSCRYNSISGNFIVDFENLAAKYFNADIIRLGKLSSQCAVILEALRGAPTTAKIPKIISNMVTKLPHQIPIPSSIRFKVNKYDTIFLSVISTTKISVLDTINWKNKRIILYIIDAWEPRLKWLSKLIDKFNIDIVLCPYLQSVEYLQERHSNVFWLPMGFNENVWKDYGLKKEIKVIQYGRKHPYLHDFFLNLYGRGYIHLLKEREILARYLNRSYFYAVFPRNLTEPQFTGNISPVAMRYYEGIACKSMPVGFKPYSKEFDLLFSDNITMIEYKNDKQFKEELDYYLRNEEEYQKAVSKNYEHVHKEHTWASRIKILEKILRKEGIL